MFVETEATESPDRLRFLPGEKVLGEGELEFTEKSQTVTAPLARRLFEVEGVAAVTLGPDWITVTRGGRAANGTGGDWQQMKPALLGAIMEHYVAGAPAVFAAPKDTSKEGALDTEALTGQIREALGRVIDPELGYDIVGLGLIYDVTVDPDGNAHVLMTTTTVGCPATDYLMEGSRDATGSVEGVQDIEIELTYDPRWDPSMMTPMAKSHFGITD